MLSEEPGTAHIETGADFAAVRQAYGRLATVSGSI